MPGFVRFPDEAVQTHLLKFMLRVAQELSGHELWVAAVPFLAYNNTCRAHFPCEIKKWCHITWPTSRRQRINEKVLIPPFCPSGVCCIGISRARDRHQSIQKFFHGPIDDYSC